MSAKFQKKEEKDLRGEKLGEVVTKAPKTKKKQDKYYY